MPALCDYTNVYNTALAVLKEKGYQLWYNPASEMFGAERDGWDFLADTPSALLGMVAIYESSTPGQYSDYWWRKDAEQLYGRLPVEPRAYTSAVYQRRKET
ncbi:hypothetical protein EER27_04295 [Lysobacter psychrotolerans]|uniref:Uncharacterized protein n=2 Tax=Montanilutibacter psychrotolerans TaxID=1327343 RepID=A0A3M8T1S4_9GAMM|nr:hypothetical protein EER27_04295 [Lysobacter psychrotolerans]